MTMDDILPEFMKGDAEAIHFNTKLYQIVELWDDLIDGDEAKPETINATFYAALITLPRNAFYQRNFALLNPLIEAAILDWFTANTMEKKKDVESLRTSYILRCSIQAVTIMCARIIGGVDWACAVGLRLRTLGDSWAEYASEFGVK